MSICKGCEKVWDCEDPCEEVVGYEKLPPEYYQQGVYQPKGVPLYSEHGSAIRTKKAKLGGLRARGAK